LAEPTEFVQGREAIAVPTSNENRELDEKRPMHRRFARINDAPILEVAAFLTD
jgi:hypothetical protein